MKTRFPALPGTAFGISINRLWYACILAMTLAASMFCQPVAAAVDEADVRAQYDFETMVIWNIKEVLVSQIVTNDLESANAALTRIKAGEPFEKVAAAVSVDMASKDKGGDLGWAKPSSYFPEVEAALKKMKPGEISSEPVHSKLGWHVFVLRQERKQPQQPYAAEHDKLVQAMTDRFKRIDELARDLNADRELAKREPTEYLLRQIIVNKEDDAKLALARLGKGEDFGALARDMSINDYSKYGGGRLPWQTTEKLEPAMRAVVLGMQVGETYTQPVQTTKGWLVLMLEAERPFAHSVAGEYSEKELNAMFGTWPSGPPVLREMLRAGANPNTVVNGVAPLSAYCFFGSTEAMRMMLDAGANPNLTTPKVDSPLISCLAGRDPLQTVPMIMKAGARVDQLDNYGVTPLSEAMQRDDVNLLRIMLANGAPLEMSSRDGYTALARAAYDDKADMVRILLDAGANPLHPIPGLKSADQQLYTALSAAHRYHERTGQAPACLPMLREAAGKAVRTNSRRTFTAVVVQDGKRQPLDGRPVTLKRAPFGIEFVLQHGGNDVLVAMSDDAKSIAAISHDADSSPFGDGANVIKDDDSERQTLAVSNAANFKYHHWMAFSKLSHLQTQPSGPNLEVRVSADVRTLRYLRADPAAGSETEKTVDVSKVDQPLYLLIGVGESAGAPFTAVTKMVSTPIQWR